MKILVFSQYYYPENFRINSLCEELVKRGHEVTVLTGYPSYPYGEIYEGYGFFKKYEKNVNGVKIIRMPVVPRGHNSIMMLFNMVSYVLLGYIWALFTRGKFDKTFVFEVSPVTVALPAVFLKKLKKVPVYMNVQDLWPENVEVILGITNKYIIGIINRIVDYIYRNVDKVLCSSNSFVDRICNRGHSEEKVLFWPQFAEDIENSGDIPMEYDSELFNTVFAGNIGEAQGIDTIISASEILKEENIKFFIVGDGRAKERLVELVKKKGIEENVIFTGRKSPKDAQRYIKHADCALLTLSDNPLFKMTIPAKLQTYLSCGVPIVASADGEVKEIINNNGCGICVSSGDAKAFAEAVLRIKHTKTCEKEVISENSRKYFENNFKKDMIVDKLESLMNTEVT